VNKMKQFEYYIIKNLQGDYLYEDYSRDDVFPIFWTSLFYKARRFHRREVAVTYMKIENIKGIIYKVFYKELRSD